MTERRKAQSLDYSNSNICPDEAKLKQFHLDSVFSATKHLSSFKCNSFESHLKLPTFDKS